MARDTQAALVALNRFGFGARGGASGDLINAASDPRGFVKAELARANGVLRDQFGLSDRVLAETVFPDSTSAQPMKGLVAWPSFGAREARTMMRNCACALRRIPE